MSNLMSHMRISAEEGNADAQFNLGVLLGNGFDEKGRFVGAKREEALDWLEKAANAGLSRAQFKLAQNYAEGETPEELERAGTWFLVAIDNADGGGGQRARDGFEALARKLSEEQLDRARTNADAWTTKIERAREERDRAINDIRKQRRA